MAVDETTLSDKLVHLGRGPVGSPRQVNLPIELGSTVVFDSLAEFEAARDARYNGKSFYYGRFGNPAVFELEAMMAHLDGADSAIAVSSGVAAIAQTLSGLLKPGDHLLVADNVYGNTRVFCDRVLAGQNVTVDYFDPMRGAGLKALFRPNTAAVMFEAPGSATFETPDIPAITRVARDANVITVLDGTWATPVFCRPLALGVDVVVHSGSKYIGGHSDCMIGFICGCDTVMPQIRKTVRTYGDKPGAQEVFLALRGLRTLEMRMRAADAAGRRIAGWLAEQPQVRTVLHPAFPNCPGHVNWKRDFEGAAGLFGVVFQTPSADRIRAFVDRLQAFGIGVSWGGFESLVLPMTPTRTATRWDEPGQLVRFHIGFETPETLIRDLADALPLLDD